MLKKIFTLLILINSNLSFSQTSILAGSTTQTVGTTDMYFIGGVICGMPDDCNYQLTLQSGPSVTIVNWSASPCEGNTFDVTFNGCGTVVLQGLRPCDGFVWGTKTITVTGPAPGSAPTAIGGGTGTYCPSASTTITSSCASGTIEWYTGSCGGTSVGSGNSYNSTAAGTTTYYARCENTCGTSSCVSKTVTRSAIPPTPGAIAGATPICSSSQNYSIAAVGGATSYTWAYTGGGTPGGTTTSTTFTPTSSGTLSVTANNVCGSSSTSTLAITVNSIPATPGIIIGSTSTCSGSQTYSIAAVGGATSYTWSYSGGGTPGGTTTSTTFTPTSSGILTVTANNACGSSLNRTVAITVNSTPATPGAIAGATPICSSSQTYSIGAVAGATSYTWAYTGGGAPGGTTTSTTFTPTSSGTLSVTANNTCGSSSTSTLVITVNSTPATPGAITGSTSTCSGSQTYSITAVGGATSYTWSYSGGGTPGGTTTSTTFTPTSNGILTVTANNACGSSLNRTVAITVNSIPATPGIISGATPICSSSQTYSITAVGGATSYTWAYSGGGTPGGTTTSTTFTPTSAGTLSVTANNTCGASSTRTLVIAFNPVPATPGAIAGATPICSSSQTYSIGAVGGATSYTWAHSGGGTPPGTAISTTFTPTSSGTLSVTANNACGSSSIRTLVITVTSIPATPGAIAGATPICSSSQTYSTGAVGGATSYTWAYTGGGTPLGTTNSTTFTPTSSGTLSVTANNACGSSSTRTLAITVTSIPSTPGAIAGATPICSSSQTYSIGAVGGATSYTWTYSGGGTPPGTGISTTFTPTSAGTLSVTANNACGSSSTRTLVIAFNPVPATPGAIAGATPICSSSQTYSIGAVGGATSYTWAYSGGGTPLGTTTSTTFTPTSSGTLFVTANNPCGSSSTSTLAITVTNIPSTPGAIAGATPICSSSQTYSIGAVAGATSYTWAYTGGGTPPGTTTSTTFTPTSSGTLSVTANNTCGSSSTSTLIITITVIPSTPGAIAGATPICSSSQTYSIGAVAGATSYTWTYTGGGTPPGTTTSTTFTPTSAGTLSVTANNACGSSSTRTLVIAFNPVPATPGAIAGATPICSSSQTYSIAAVGGATSYTWAYTGGGTPSGTTTSTTFTPTSSGTLSVTANNACGASSTSTLAITVTSIPSTPGAIAGASPICSSSQTYSIAAVGGATSYTWAYTGGGTPPGTTTSTTFTPTSSGILSVTANNTCGASSTNTLIITIASIPTLPTALATSNNNLCTGFTTNLSANCAIGIVRWYTSALGTGTGAGYITNPHTVNNNQTVYARCYEAANPAGCQYSVANSIGLTVSDVVNPIIVCSPATFYLSPAGTVLLDTTNIVASTSDNCLVDSVWIKNTDTLMNCSNIGVNSVTIYITDGVGNIDSCISNITILDTINPNPICKDTTIYLDITGNFIIDSSYIDNGSNAACGIATITLSKTVYNCSDVGVNPITMYVTDVNGNLDSCTANVTVVDTVNPNPICKDTTIYLDFTGNATIDSSYINNLSSDVCGIATITLSQTTYNCSELGVNPITLYVTDVNGNIDSCIANVTVVDTINPTIACSPATFYIGVTGTVTLDTANLVASVSDNCGIDSVWIKSSDVIMSCLNIGTSSVTVFVSDVNGNIDSCSSVATILDTLKPTAICKDTVIYLDATGQFTIDSSFVDNGSNSVCYDITETLSQYTFTCADMGINPVNLIVTNNTNLKDSCIANVTVLDTNAPVFVSCPTDINETTEASCEYTVPDFTAGLTITDNCDGTTPVLLAQNPSAGTIIKMTTGTTNQIQGVIITATDGSNNIDSCGFDINLTCITELKIPQFISPNGDGLNDKWVIDFIEQYPNCNVKIFNRLGTIIYQMDAYDNSWNGKSNANYTVNTQGSTLPSGTYYYIVDKGNGDLPDTGYVVIRK